MKKKPPTTGFEALDSIRRQASERRRDTHPFEVIANKYRTRRPARRPKLVLIQGGLTTGSKPDTDSPPTKE